MTPLFSGVAKQWKIQFERWQVGVWKVLLHHLAAWLLLLVPTYMYESLNCWFSTFSSWWEVVTVWWPAVAYLLRNNPFAKHRGKPWWQSAWVFSSSEQHRAPQQYEDHSERKSSFYSPQRFCNVTRLAYPYVTAQVPPFFLPRHLARRVTSELAADVRSDHGY